MEIYRRLDTLLPLGAYVINGSLVCLAMPIMPIGDIPILRRKIINIQFCYYDMYPYVSILIKMNNYLLV